jgi:hypothetical protein
MKIVLHFAVCFNFSSRSICPKVGRLKRVTICNNTLGFSHFIRQIVRKWETETACEMRQYSSHVSKSHLDDHGLEMWSLGS